MLQLRIPRTHRRLWLALALAICFLPACRDLLVEPAPPAPVPLAVLFNLSSQSGGASAAYDKANRLRIRVVHADASAVDTELSFAPGGTQTEVELIVEPKQPNERVQLVVELLRDSDRLFRGGSEVVLQSGAVNEARVTVEPIASRIVMPPQIPVMTSLGDTLSVQGAVVFATGDTIPNATPSWSTADSRVAEVTSQGRIVSRAEGEARLVVTHAELSAEAVLRVDAVVESVTVQPTPLTLLVGESLQLTAVARDRRGNTLVRSVESWISASPLVADVAGNGMVTGRGVGTADITASVAGRSGAATISVTALAPEVETVSAANVAAQAAMLGGMVDTRGATTEAWFEWGTTPALGQTTPRQVLAASAVVYSVTGSLSGLTPDSPYFFRIVAENVGGTTRGDVRGFTTLDVPPAAPSNLGATAALLAVNLSWMDNSGNEQGFRIERRTGADGDWNAIAQVGADVTAYSDTGLAPSTTYFFRVSAFNQVGASGFSNVAPASTPAAPTASTNTASNVTAGSATLTGSVNPNAAATSVWFEWGATPQLGSETQPQSIGSGSSPVAVNASLSGLNPATTYHFRVAARNGVGTARGQTLSFTTADVAPAAPSNLSAAAQGATVIDLSWQVNSANHDGLRLERRTGAAGTWGEIAFLPANATTFSNSGLSPNTTYFYRIRACNAVGCSAYSNEAQATTAQVPPAAPSHLTATAAGTSIQLRWRDNSTNEDGFNVYRKYEREGYIDEHWTLQTHLRPGPNDTTIVDPDKEVGSTYHYRITAYNAAGESAPSNEVQATIVAAPTATTEAATNVSASGATLRGTVNPNAAATTAWFEWGTTPQLDNQTPPQAVGSGASEVTVSAVLSGLSPGTTYHFRVAARNGVGTTRGTTLNFTTQGVPPAAPSNLTASAVSASQIDLTWQDNSNNELGFRIERCTGGQCTNFVQIDSVGADVTTYNNTGLAASTTYRYRVRAYNAVGASAYSNIAAVTTLPTAPAAPSNLTATAASSSQINLNWVDNSTNEAGFRIERCTGANCSNFVEIDSVGANVTTYQNIGLAASTTYRYRVRAYNAGGVSAYSNIDAATTQPPSPAVLWNNGAFITHPNAGPGGSHISMSDPEHNTAGSNVRLDGQGPHFRIGDDFTVPAGGWTISQIITHGYEVGAAVPTWTIARLNIRSGSVTGPIVVSATTTTWEFTGVYRTFNGVLNVTDRPIFRLLFNFSNLQLAPGTYWIDWQVEAGTNGWAPFVTRPPVSPGGNNTQTVFDNGRQMTIGGVWQPTLAPPGAEVPFVILGAGQPARTAAPYPLGPSRVPARAAQPQPRDPDHHRQREDRPPRN